MTPEESAEMDRLRAENEELRVLVASAGGMPLLTAAIGADPVKREALVAALALNEQRSAEFTAWLQEVSLEGNSALVASADASLAQIEGRDLVDLAAPLSAAEFARYVGRYDRDARTAMASEGQAFRDGTIPIRDEHDLFDAIRLHGNDPRFAAHLKRAAARLGRDDLASGEWARTVAFSAPVA